MRSTAFLTTVTRLVVAATCVVILVPFLQAPAQASPRPGKPCPTLGKEISKGRWIYVCAKKGSKLVWVRKRAPQPSPEPDPATAQWQRVAVELKRGMTQRAETPTEFTFNFLVAPTVPDSRAERFQDSVVKAFRWFAPIAPLTPDYPVLIMDENSEDFYARYSETIPGDYCGDYWWNRDPKENWTLAGAVCSGSSLDQSYMAVVIGSDRTLGIETLITHEVVHIAQELMHGIPASYSMECWLGEGMAELYTSASLVRGKGQTDTSAAAAYRTFALSPLLARLREPRGATERYWLDLIVASEDRSTELCWSTGLGYSLGLLVTEKLVLDFGEGKLIDWLVRSRDVDSESAFTEVFGITQSQWYEQSVASYVLAQVLRLRDLQRVA